MKKTIGTVLVLGALVPLAACGGGVGSKQAEKLNKATTHAEFVSEMNKLCRDNENDFGDGFESQDWNVMADQLDEALPKVDEALDNMREVDPPDEDAAAYERYMESFVGIEDVLGDFADALRENDLGQLLVIGERVDAINKKMNAAARDLGATDCIEES